MLILALPSCNRPDDHSGDGAIYKEKLVAAIRSSDSIRLAEHSHWSDFSHLDDEDPANQAPVYLYRSQTLPDASRATFLKKAEDLPPDTINYFAACIFAPHHTIEFQKEGKVTSTMEICFQCGQVEWTGAPDERLPEHLIRMLEEFVSESGYEPDRDWRTVADQRRAQEGGDKPTTPPTP